MRKRILALTLAVVLLLTVPAQAAVQLISFSPVLTFDGTEATCELKVVGETGDEIEATLSLWRGSTMLATWSKEGTSYVRISQTKTVTKGYTYTLKADVTINGVAYDQNTVSGKCG